MTLALYELEHLIAVAEEGSSPARPGGQHPPVAVFTLSISLGALVGGVLTDSFTLR